jgi:hypothetical protein
MSEQRKFETGADRTPAKATGRQQEGNRKNGMER